jgi:hypothetical protein
MFQKSGCESPNSVFVHASQMPRCQRMIGLMIAGDEFAAGRIDRMQVRAVFEDGIHAFGHIAGLHLVIADGFAADGEVEDGAELFGGDVGGDGLTDKETQKGAKE